MEGFLTSTQETTPHSWRGDSGLTSCSSPPSSAPLISQVVQRKAQTHMRGSPAPLSAGVSAEGEACVETDNDDWHAATKMGGCWVTQATILQSDVMTVARLTRHALPQHPCPHVRSSPCVCPWICLSSCLSLSQRLSLFVWLSHCHCHKTTGYVSKSEWVSENDKNNSKHFSVCWLVKVLSVNKDH